MPAPAPSSDESLSNRVLTGAAGLALAVLFGGLGVLIVRAPHSPGTPWWAVWLIRVFVASMFGAMAVLGLHMFVTAIRGPRVRPLPRLLLTRCAACGEPVSPATASCPGCGRAPGRVGRAWTEMSQDGAGAWLMGLGIGVAVASMGVFLLVSAFSGEEHLFFSLALGALGLLMLAVGGALLVGALLVLRDAIRNFGKRSFALRDCEGPVTFAATADISFRSAALSGTTLTALPFDDAPEPEPFDGVLPSPLRALVRAIAALHATGQVHLLHLDTREWTAGAKGPPSRTREIDVQIDLPFDADPDDPDDPDDSGEPVAPHDPVLALLSRGFTVRSLAENLSADPEVRNLFETYAAGLKPSQADARTAGILGALLAEGGAAAPYRQPG